MVGRVFVFSDRPLIGVSAYQYAKDVILPKVLAMPFEKQRLSFQGPDGKTPTRPPEPRPRLHLLP